MNLDFVSLPDLVYQPNFDHLLCYLFEDPPCWLQLMHHHVAS